MKEAYNLGKDHRKLLDSRNIFNSKRVERRIRVELAKLILKYSEEN